MLVFVAQEHSCSTSAEGNVPLHAVLVVATELSNIPMTINLICWRPSNVCIFPAELKTGVDKVTRMTGWMNNVPVVSLCRWKLLINVLSDPVRK